MSSEQQCKYVQVIAPVAITDDATWVNTEIDTLDYDYLTVIFNLGVTDIGMAALKLQSSDTSGSGFTDVTGLIVGTSADADGTTSVLPSATDDGNVVVFQVDLRGKERFFDLVATAGDGTLGTYGSAVGILSKGAVTPTTVAQSGAETLLRV